MSIPYEKETKLVSDVLALLLALGIPAIRVNAGAMKTERGFYRSVSVNGCSDVLACLPVRFMNAAIISRTVTHADFAAGIPVTHPAAFTGVGVMAAIECKVGKRTTTDDQDAFLAAITRAGGIAIVARSLEDVERMLEEVGIDPRKANCE